MFIKSIMIEGVEGDVEILHTEHGVLVTSGNTILCEVRRDEEREARFAKAYKVARVICGQVRDRGPRGTGEMVPNATGSMVQDILDEIERIAKC